MIEFAAAAATIFLLAACGVAEGPVVTRIDAETDVCEVEAQADSGDEPEPDYGPGMPPPTPRSGGHLQ